MKKKSWKHFKINAKLEGPWKRPDTKFLAEATYSNTQAYSRVFNKLMEENFILEWLTAGVTYLIPKNENTGNPKNYRPVTCLPMTYKLLTSIISKRMQKYVDTENLLPKEQKGCSSETKGCKDQLLISKVILRERKSRKKV